MIYSVYVGKYPSPNVSKSDLKKLNELGLVGYLFSMGDHFSLKVYTTLNVNQANTLKENLERKGFVAFIESKEIKK